MLLQARNSHGRTPLLGSGIHLLSSRAIHNLSPLSRSNNMTSALRAGWKLAIKHFLYVWLTSRRRAIKAQRGHGGSLCSLYHYFQARIKSVSSALISEYDSGLPWLLFLSVMKVSLGMWLKDSFPRGSRRGWGSWFKLCLEKGVDYRNLAVEPAFCRFTEQICSLTLHQAQL